MAITSARKDKRLYKVRFVVQGTGAFPLDMLRYDQCHFLIETDSRHAEATLSHAAEIDSYFYAMASFQEYGKWEPTVGRWKSFGFEVVELHNARDFVGDLCLRPA